MSKIATCEINEQIANHLNSRFVDVWAQRQISYHFRRFGYVKLTGLIPTNLVARVGEEVVRLLDLDGQRIDLRLRETGNSPRFMTTLSQTNIRSNSELIPAVYDCEALRVVLSHVAGEPLFDCPWEGEKYIAIRQERQGDTHGWHWGDFAFTLIWVLQAPDGCYGGQLQTVPHTTWVKDDPRLHEHLELFPIRTWPHVSGDLYFLRSDTTLHRTVPLTANRTRIILNTCWGSEADHRRGASHETMEAMFD